MDDFGTGLVLGFIITFIACTVGHVIADYKIPLDKVDTLVEICSTHDGVEWLSSDTNEMTITCKDKFSISVKK